MATKVSKKAKTFKAGMVSFTYANAKGEVKEYAGVYNPDQTNDTHIGLKLDRHSPNLVALKESGEYEQARKANGQFKPEYRRFIRDNIIGEVTEH